MQSAGWDIRRPKSIATAGKPFATPSHARACGRDAAENLEDVDALASRPDDAAQPDQVAWLHDRRQAPRRASTLPDEDGRAWSRHDGLSSPDRPPSSESAKAPPRRTDGRGL